MRRGIDYKGAADKPPGSFWSQLAINLRPYRKCPGFVEKGLPPVTQGLDNPDASPRIKLSGRRIPGLT